MILSRSAHALFFVRNLRDGRRCLHVTARFATFVAGHDELRGKLLFRHGC
jgi:hypothetical protein